GTPGTLGSRLGRRSDERRLATLARRTPLRRAEAAAAAPPLLPSPGERDHGDTGPLVTHRAIVRGSAAGPARTGGAPTRAAGNRHARRRSCRGDPRWLQRRLRRAEGARDARPLPARLLRRWPRRRPVRARRSGRAAAGTATARRRRAGSARARGRRSRSAVRRGPAVAETGGGESRTRRRRQGRPAGRRAGAL